MKLTTLELIRALDEARERAPVGSVWGHYKGGTYVVTGHYFDTGLERPGISYRRIDGPEFDPIVEANVVFGRDSEEWYGHGSRLMANTKRFTRIG